MHEGSGDVRIQISKRADLEIDEIEDYLRRNFGAKVADQKLVKLYKDINMLASHPFMGRSCDGHDENLRQIFCAPNVIIYDIDDVDKVIEIVHIVDARADYVRLLND